MAVWLRSQLNFLLANYWIYQQMSPTLFSWHHSHLFQDLQTLRCLPQLCHLIAGHIGHAGGWLLIYHQTE